MAPGDIRNLLPSASRHIHRRIYDALPIPGVSIPDWWRLERETYCLGAWLITPKGRKLFKAISNYNCHYLSTGGPTYWPTDLTNLPDLLDFLVARGIPVNYNQIESAFDLSSDHSPVIATIGASTINKAAIPTLTTTHTNWDMFRAYINDHINLRLRIKECAELDEVKQYFTTLLQAAAWHTTPPPRTRTWPVDNTPLYIRELIAERRRSRGRWQRSRNQGDRFIIQPFKKEVTNCLTECQ